MPFDTALLGNDAFLIAYIASSPVQRTSRTWANFICHPTGSSTENMCTPEHGHLIGILLWNTVDLRRAEKGCLGANHHSGAKIFHILSQNPLTSSTWGLEEIGTTTVPPSISCPSIAANTMHFNPSFLDHLSWDWCWQPTTLCTDQNKERTFHLSTFQLKRLFLYCSALSPLCVLF